MSWNVRLCRLAGAECRWRGEGGGEGVACTTFLLIGFQGKLFLLISHVRLDDDLQNTEYQTMQPTNQSSYESEFCDHLKS